MMAAAPSMMAVPLPQDGLYNRTRRVTFRGGWFGLLSGESQGKAIERALADFNREGYRVVFILPDKWNIIRHLFAWLLAIITLGIVVFQPNVLIIGEPIPIAFAGGYASSGNGHNGAVQPAETGAV